VGFHLKFLVMGVARTNHFSLRQRCALATQLSLQSKSNIDQTCIRCNVPDHFLPPLYHILARWKCTLSGSRGLHVNSTVLPVGSFSGARADRVHTTPCMVCGKTFLPGRLFCSPALTPKLLRAGYMFVSSVSKSCIAFDHSSLHQVTINQTCMPAVVCYAVSGPVCPPESWRLIITLG
jgi:hypothetical protein